MLSFFPHKLSSRAVAIYVGALILVSLAFNQYAMRIPYVLLGLVLVIGFFALSSMCSKSWSKLSRHDYWRAVFFTSLSVRLLWVVFSYFFYKNLTGVPFEPDAGDSMGYHAMGVWLRNEPMNKVFYYLFTSVGTYSDSGYNLYLTLLYKLIGPNIFLTRVIKAFISSFTCCLIYKLAARSINEEVGRVAGVFSVFMPNLIIYCGLHLKETEMIFLAVAFLERTDYLIRTRKYTILTILLPMLLAVSLFLFRTVLGAVAVFSFITGLLFTSSGTVGRRKRLTVILWGLLAVGVFAGGTIANEVESVFEERTENQIARRTAQTKRGNQWAKYATGTVMAPMMFVLPFPTMVDVDHQYNQQIMHGGNYVRNYMGFFVLLALFVAVFKTKKWRDFSLVGSYTIAYLAILSLSGFANSERFLLPALPGLVIIWAYGVANLSKQSLKYLKYWQVVVFIMPLAWAFFKLGSRGLF